MMLNTTDSVPTEASQLMLNLWSNGQSFSGPMRVGREVYIAVQWIEMAYNVSSPSQSSNQTDGQMRCSVDSVTTKGTPEVVQSSSATTRAVSTALNMSSTVVLVLIAWSFI